jgi:hypothetical protein
MAEPERRRRRVRSSHSAPPPASTPPASAPPPSAPPDEPPAERPRRGGEDAERGLRGLVGSGSSQVSVGAALRARDAARPTEEHLAEAERLPIVRRNWTPREELPRTNR